MSQPTAEDVARAFAQLVRAGETIPVKDLILDLSVRRRAAEHDYARWGAPLPTAAAYAHAILYGLPEADAEAAAADMSRGEPSPASAPVITTRTVEALRMVAEWIDEVDDLALTASLSVRLRAAGFHFPEVPDA